jgi:large subunit ribosomal protein L24e
VRRDGQPVLLSGSKSKRLLINRKKPSKLMWTQAWRRLNKKGKDDGSAKKRVRKVAKVQRAIVGASLDDVREF